MPVKELISKLPELYAALNRVFKNGAIFNSRYPMISYGGDSQDQQPAKTDDKKISQS